MKLEAKVLNFQRFLLSFTPREVRASRGLFLERGFFIKNLSDPQNRKIKVFSPSKNASKRFPKLSALANSFIFIYKGENLLFLEAERFFKKPRK